MYYLANGMNANPNFLSHHGIKGQKWGIRRYQNPDGTLTAAGKERYNPNKGFDGEDRYTLYKKAEAAEARIGKDKADAIRKGVNDYYQQRMANAKEAYNKETGRDYVDDFNRSSDALRELGKRGLMRNGKPTPNLFFSEKRINKILDENRPVLRIASKYSDTALAEVMAYADSYTNRDYRDAARDYVMNELIGT